MFRFRLRTLFIAVAVLAVPMAWVGNRYVFDWRFARVKAGQTRASVIELLGQPVTEYESNTSPRPDGGPSFHLEQLLGKNVPYEEWKYTTEPRVYYVWFAGKAASAKKDWAVVDTSSYEKGTKF